jgi:ADP-ribose pyrophosphatase YjhB (NUDIX family)
MEHFAPVNFKPQIKYLPAETYGYARDSIVRGCVEAMVMDKKMTKVLLGRRNIKPWDNWWTFGGRMFAGESPKDAVLRTVKEDLGLKVLPKRFSFLDTMSLVFSKRQEHPQKNGCHDIALFFLLLLSEQEIAKIFLRETEYQEKKWFSLKNITKKAGFHPATVICLKKAMLLKKIKITNKND